MNLTPRESEILSLIANGNKRMAVAKDLGVTFDTINYHLDNVRLKLEAKNTVHAVAICIREKIIT